MRWSLIRSLVILASLAGCSSPPEPPRATASFIPNSNLVQVVVHDPKPVRTVRLVAPDGRVTAAQAINTDRFFQPPSSSSSLGLGIGGFSFGRSSAIGTGVGLGVPLGTSEPRVESVASATVPIDDLDDYRRDWQRYHIEVELGDPPEVLTLAAPPPA